MEGNFLETLRTAIKQIPNVKIEPLEIKEIKLTPGESFYDDKTKTVGYVYKAGDNFGQVIKDLGLESGNGLWGENGDVAYYTKQLHDQGVSGNIPVGTFISLRHRNAPAEPKETDKKIINLNNLQDFFKNFRREG